MITRQLGKSELTFSRLGLGTWAFSGERWSHGWGPQDEKTSIRTVLSALESGINWVDTAAVYGLGKAEWILGKALKEWGDKVFVATKGGRIENTDENLEKKLISCSKKESLIRECEDSLVRLQREVIDLYQIHWPDKERIEEGYETLHLLTKQGKIRYAGVSNFSLEELSACPKELSLVSLQSPLNLLRQENSEEVIPYTLANKISFLAYSPLQTGLLSGKYSKDWFNALPETDFRKTHSTWFQEPLLSHALSFIEELKPFAQRRGLSLSQYAIAWILSQPGVDFCIIGARSPEQLPELLDANSKSIEADECEEIKGLYQQYKKRSEPKLPPKRR